MSFDLKKESEDEKGFSLEKNESQGGNSIKKSESLKKNKVNDKITSTQAINNSAKKKGLSKGIIVAVALLTVLSALWFYNQDSINNIADEQQTTIVASPEESTLETSEPNEISTIDSISNATSETVLVTENKQTTDSSKSSEGSEASLTLVDSVILEETSTKNRKVAESNIKQDSLEVIAIKVIKGIYGNGIDRKNALGAEYSIIQAKVNEMYKNGTKN